MKGGRRPYDRKSAATASGSVRAEINVTPLVDVVLVLLVIFLVVTPMLRRGVDVRLPRTRHHASQKDTGEQVVVSIKGDGSLWLDRKRVDGDKMETVLRDALRRTPGRPIHLKGDSRLRYGKVRDVLEACHRAGAHQVALITEDDE